MKVLDGDTKIINNEFMETQLALIKREIGGIPTGYADLDHQWRGIFPGNTYLIGARPGMGKTALALNMILHMTINGGQKVALFSLESSKEQLVNRLLTINSRIDSSHFRAGKFDESELETIEKSATAIANGNLIVNDTSGLDIDALENELSSDIMEGVKVVFIDYLQLLNTIHENSGRLLETYYICERIKQIAVKYNVAIIVLSQLSKAIETREDHRPTTRDFACKETANYFDNVSFIYRDEYYNNKTQYKSIAEIITAKNKYGSIGVVNLVWIPEYQIFCNIEREPGQDNED